MRDKLCLCCKPPIHYGTFVSLNFSGPIRENPQRQAVCPCSGHSTGIGMCNARTRPGSRKPYTLDDVAVRAEMLVCPTGIEPVTHSLEGCCSIQLSYGQKQETQKALAGLFCSKQQIVVFLGICLKWIRSMVGAAGFELATLCSQSRCATRLRYAPTSDILPGKRTVLGGGFKKVLFVFILDPNDLWEAFVELLEAIRKKAHRYRLPGMLVRSQLPRVMGISTLPGISRCLASSSLASELRCTSSGPSAKRRVRWWT